MKIHHINCGTLLVPGYPTVVCHCLLLEGTAGLILIDSGIGLKDVRSPDERLGQELINLAGFQFHEADTAVRRINALGLSSQQVRHVVLTHGDPDHAGGLADFPAARVHIAIEELTGLRSGHGRYVAKQYEHQPQWDSYGPSERRWFGLEARAVDVGWNGEVLLIPMFGHTHGHCGVAIQVGPRWLLHVGDAYYLRAELDVVEHPVSQLAAQRADDDQLRRTTLDQLRRLHREHSAQVDILGYHDINELPPGTPIGANLA